VLYVDQVLDARLALAALLSRLARLSGISLLKSEGRKRPRAEYLAKLSACEGVKLGAEENIIQHSREIFNRYVKLRV